MGHTELSEYPNFIFGYTNLCSDFGAQRRSLKVMDKKCTSLDLADALSEKINGYVILDCDEKAMSGEEELEHLSTVIKQVNNQTGSYFDVDVASKSLLQIKNILMKLKDMEISEKNNTLNNFGFEFNDKVDDALLD